MTFIKFSTGDAIRADTIFAVRVGDASKTDDLVKGLHSRVIVDFSPTNPSHMYGEHSNCIIIDCDNDQERNDLKNDIVRKIEAAGRTSKN